MFKGGVNLVDRWMQLWGSSNIFLDYIVMGGGAFQHPKLPSGHPGYASGPAGKPSRPLMFIMLFYTCSDFKRKNIWPNNRVIYNIIGNRICGEKVIIVRLRRYNNIQ